MHAPAERDEDQERDDRLEAHRDEQQHPVPDDERAREPHDELGFLRKSRSYARPAIGIAISDAIDVSESIQPRVYAL